MKGFCAGVATNVRVALSLDEGDDAAGWVGGSHPGGALPLILPTLNSQKQQNNLMALMLEVTQIKNVTETFSPNIIGSFQR